MSERRESRVPFTPEQDAVALLPGSRADARTPVELKVVNRRAALALGVGLGAALWVAGPSAWALGGKVIWRKTTISEIDGTWKVQVEIHLDKTPDVAHLPVRFSFKPIVHYERALVDGQDKPVTRKIPLEHQTPLIEGVDVGFMDPGTAKIEKRTRFSFEVTRERGYEAGEYEVEISDTRGNGQIGATQRLVLEGDNPVVDRRAMVFSEKKKEAPSGAAAGEQKAVKRELSPDDPEYWQGGSNKPAPEDKPLPPPASMQEKPGGCGCRVGGEATGKRLGAAAFGALVLGLIARRR
jgi:MYXO-CTERM domain-containing protein